MLKITKKCKRAVLTVMTALIVVIAMNVVVYAFSGKNVWEFFFSDSEKNMSYIMEKYDQTVTIDQYTIKLDSAIFDDKTETIYCMFRVSNAEGKVEAVIDKYGSMDNAFGVNSRFSIWVDADTGGSGALTGKYEGNELLIYGEYTYHCDETEDAHAIYLFDSKENQTNFENYAAKFDLKPTTNVIEFQVSNKMKIVMSPIAIKIESVEKIDTENIEICYKDGTTEEIVNVKEKVGIGSSSSTVTISGFTEIYVDFSLIDIKCVESVIYNGKKISR